MTYQLLLVAVHAISRNWNQSRGMIASAVATELADPASAILEDLIVKSQKKSLFALRYDYAHRSIWCAISRLFDPLTSTVAQPDNGQSRESGKAQAECKPKS